MNNNMKKTISVITCIDFTNYGNRLQNYAVHEAAKKIGLEAYSILFDHPEMKKKGKHEIIIEIFEENGAFKGSKLIVFHFIRKIKSLFNRSKDTLINENEEVDFLNELKKVRSSKFKEFTRKYLKTYILDEEAENNMYSDYYIIGSDQVWNPFFGVPTPYDFLSFAPKEKRVSYSASFGVSRLPKSTVLSYRKGLKGIPHISVREEDGAKIVKKLTGRNVPVLVDPTMMLDAEEWRNIAKPIQKVPEGNYLLTFFLGEVSDERRNKIQKIADKAGYIIINLNDITDPERYVIAPDEFISYIDKAGFIVTDSFHGTVFSILFNKPFIVFERVNPDQPKATSMHSRIDTLLTKFRLRDRFESNIENCKNLYQADYSHVPTVLDQEREKAYNFLKGVMAE
jgi:hypothetical protein